MSPPPPGDRVGVQETVHSQVQFLSVYVAAEGIFNHIYNIIGNTVHKRAKCFSFLDFLLYFKIAFLSN